MKTLFLKYNKFSPSFFKFYNFFMYESGMNCLYSEEIFSVVNRLFRIEFLHLI